MTYHRNKIFEDGNFKVIKIEDDNGNEKNREVYVDNNFVADTYEYTTYKMVADLAKGKVLLAGLGLGTIIDKLEQNQEVTEIFVVELQQKIKDYHATFKPNHSAQVNVGDIMSYSSDKPYDFMFSDILSLNESHEDVVDLMEKVIKQAYKLLKQGGTFVWWEYNVDDTFYDQFTDKWEVIDYRTIKYGEKIRLKLLKKK